MTFDVTSREHVRDALGLAKESTACSGYTDAAEGGDLAPADLEKMRAAGSGPLWYAWSGPKEDSLAVAITGNGPTSKANAKFFACAREVVLALGEEVQRLRIGMAAMAAHHALCAEEEHIRATDGNDHDERGRHIGRAQRDQLVAKKLLELIGPAAEPNGVAEEPK